ncbi:MAG: bifunctional glutamate--cysteine ligase GshA/glutathione synthetase GshB [Vagococcus salmoninarum]|uniref:bifunctional glutamate--cysteine ligase GshA/glutathione synthetase GshB n=1 Tax=Vagococcus salmoninarum TaxID=2739 RepID=UPI003F9B9E65
MKTLQKALSKEGIRSLFKEVRIGLEKESQRVTLDGQLAKSDHPETLGCRSYHPSIQTDFSETQVELITPVASSAREVLEYLAANHEVVLRSMNKDEMLWPMSMPPILPEKDEDIIIAKLERFQDVLYRRYLARSYGKRKQMISGIHYNFEFAPELITKLFKEQSEFATLDEFKTEVYLKVSRNYLRFRWFITYLLGASPVSETGYFTGQDVAVPDEPVRSIRNSDFGYTNHDDVFVSYKSIQDYVAGIERLVDQGIMSEEKEFYSPVRLRGGKTVADLKAHGVHYIEVRNIDNDPFAKYGIKEENIEFLHFFLMYMLWLDNDHCEPDELIKKGDRLNNEVALERPLSQTQYAEEGLSIINGMLEMAEEIQLNQSSLELIETYRQAFSEPAKTLSGQLVSLFEAGTSHHDFAVAKGQAYKESAEAKPYQLAGYRDMELSTQILMFDAIQRGIDVEVIDRHDQFLKLKFNKEIEYVKNANMTSRDNYVVPLIMENKTVTKKLLAQAGFRVPQGKEYASAEDALADFGYFGQAGIVIKPKSTNYGIGISIFKEGADFESYQEAIRLAFLEDSEVLVEEFLTGTEYRFFVIDNQVKAILLRIPANVTGDGKQTIAELVAAKNEDPLRGTHHRAPLEQIMLGDIEKLMLSEQGYTVDSILAEGELVYLRENSNVSTGGDSIDVTDEFDDSYKKIAIEAVAALGAKISGIDLIILDANEPAERKSSQYGIIEANFNPAMHMHVYPFKGTGRRLTEDVLDLLYPELKK